MPEMASDQEGFERLLEGLMGLDNAARTQNEEAYDGIQPQVKIPLLIQAMMRQDGKIESRTMAAVLLRRMFTSNFDEFWKEFPENVKDSVKQQMLLCIQQEQNATIRKKICECTAEFARNMLDDDGIMTWPDVLKFMFEGANSPDPNLKESVLLIFSIVPGIFGTQQTHYLDVIKQMLAHSLSDQANANVRFTAVKATCAFILVNDSQTQVLNHFKDLLDRMLSGIEESIHAQQDDSLLKSLIELAENTPKFLRPQVDRLMQLCIKVVADSNIMDQWRQLALEVLVSLAENAPAMVRKFGAGYMGILVQEILKMMVEVEEEEDWSLQDEVEDDDCDSNAIAGESALDRLACALAGKAMLPHIITHVPAMLKHAEWTHRHAGLMAISACGEGCHKQMESMLDSIVDNILPHLQDPHPRVRYAACNALGQLSTDFGPVFQKKFHEKVVSGLLFVMDDNNNPRVQAHAGAALVNFSEDCPKSILTPYLDMIMAKLDQILQAKFRDLVEKNQKLVLEQVVTTLASVADTAEDRFINYYERFMPNLKYIVANANTEPLRMLRGKTIECVSLIGLAVGKEKFMPDSHEVMALLLNTQTEWAELPDDDPQLSYMISAWARMCKIMGPEFTKYLPQVMPPILKAAQIKPEVALVDSEDQKVMENEDWQFVTLGDQQSFGIKTSGLEEKATACQMLVCYARELKEGFAPYAEQVATIMVSHLKFYFHDGVRIAAAESLPYLLDCAKVKGPEFTATLWQNVILPHVLGAIDTEHESDIKAEHMHSLAQCIEKLGGNSLQESQMLNLVSILEKILQAHFEKQASRLEMRKEEDYDEDVEDTLLEEDDEDVYILSKLSEIIHSLFGTYNALFLPFFDKMLPAFVKLLGAERPWADRQWSLCIFDDLIEHTGPASFKYESYFLENMVRCICDKQGELRQAATYGVGVMAMCGGPNYVPTLKAAMPLLLQMIQHPESRQPENANPTENAISALTKICKYQAAAVGNLDEVLAFWFSCLPVWEDEDEALHIYSYLCDLIQANHPLMLQQLPRVVMIIAEAFSKEAVPIVSEVGKRMGDIITQLQQDQQVFQTCISQLNEVQQTALSQAVSKQRDQTAAT